MLSINEQKSLIEKFVRANKNFIGNEDLFDDFCAEALQKSYMIFNSSNNIQKIESYISKVVHTSILAVLKDYGRIKRENKKYVPTREVKIADFNIEPKASKEIQDYIEEYPIQDLNVQSAIDLKSSFILDFPDPKNSVEEVLITRDCLQRIADSVCIIHSEVPSQQFLDIFYLRYMKGYKQTQIAEELELSQSEVSKRLMRLSKLISNITERGKI